MTLRKLPLIDGNLSTTSPWLKYVMPKQIIISFNIIWMLWIIGVRLNDMLPKPSKCHVMHVDFLKSPVQLPQLSLGGEALQVVDHMKLLGLEIQNNLGWDIQVRNMISRAGRRLFILYTPRKFGAPVEDMLAVFIRPILEYACAVWHPALTKQQSHQLERIKKRSCKIILGNNYQDYPICSPGP